MAAPKRVPLVQPDYLDKSAEFLGLILGRFRTHFYFNSIFGALRFCIRRALGVRGSPAWESDTGQPSRGHWSAQLCVLRVGLLTAAVH